MAALARRLNVPFRSGGALCASKLPDAQAAHESSQTLMPTVLGGVNFVLHAAGWLEGGLVSSYEKFIIDADQLGLMQTFCAGDRKSVVKGKSVSVRVDLGGRRIIKNKHKKVCTK